MENKVLIAVDLSENSLRAVDYVGRVLACHPNATITLMSVIKEPSPDVIANEEERQSHVERSRREVLTLMEQAGQRLTARGVNPKHIKLMVQVCSKPVSVAELILHEQQKGGYDTVVIGRRGVSKREEFLFGSVSNRVMREAKGCTVWIVE